MLPWQVTMVPLFITYRRISSIDAYLPLRGAGNLWQRLLYLSLLRQFFLTLPEELSEAARLEGASEFDMFGASCCHCPNQRWRS